MKPRDRQASGGMPPQAALAVPLKEPTNGSAASYQVGPAGSFLWEDWYRSASPDQQAEVLELARRQGLLYSHQIPPHANGHHHGHNGTETPADSQVLKDLLNGQAGKIAPIIPAVFEPADRELDPLQRQAVARALATPDLCLIQGPPGTGKSRVVREILVQASQRGLRVLFLSQNPACVDGVLEQVARHEGLLPIRLTSPGETIPSAVQPMLLVQRIGNFRSQILEKANGTRVQSEETCRVRQGQSEIWPAFTALVEQRRLAEEQLHRLADEMGRVAGDVESHADSVLGESLASLIKKKDDDLELVRKSLAGIDLEMQNFTQEETDVGHQLQALIEQSTSGWWTVTRWTNLFSSKIAASKAETEAKLQTIRAALAVLNERRQALGLQNQQIEQTFRAERERLLQEEIARRHRSLSGQEAEIKSKLLQTHEQWQALASRLEVEKLRPAGMTVEAVEEARRQWQTQRQLDEENCLLARQWSAFLQESGERLAARLPGLAGIVAGSLAAWNHEMASIPGSFDLLVLEEADKVSEQTLLQLARKAHRWILIGNYLGQPLAAAPAPANPREVRPAPRFGVFQKLWQLLHADPSQLPYTWGEENGRLVCQFRHLTPHELGRLERESLADAADIELRILTMPRSEPVLAQVAFPAGTTLCKAKEFIFRELQETPMQTSGRNGFLEERTDSFFWRLLPHPEPKAPASDFTEPEAQARGLSTNPQSVCLETGLLEWLHRDQTMCLEFAKSRWSRTQAIDWLRGHFRHHDLGRTVFLQVPHRMEGNLAAWVGDIHFPGTLYSIKPPSRGSDCPVAFVPVMAPIEPTGRGKKPPRETPCLEIDLAAGRGIERLPQDLLTGMVRHGFANYAEAQAVIRTLENLNFTATAPGCIGVIAFHAGQVELIRRLVARSTALTGRAVEVGLPGQFLHAQCQVAVISLTRSNSLRTGVFATETTDPILAMTRARERLVLVGDPETLVRWSQGPDATESADGREKVWLRRLAHYLRREGHHQKEFKMELEFRI